MLVDGRRRTGALSFFRRQLGKTEVENLQLSAGRDEYVSRLDVPVDDPGGVCGSQGVSHLYGHLEKLIDFDRAGRNAPVQRLSLEQLQHDVGQKRAA